MNAREAEQRFVETMSAWLVALPFDLKILYEIVDDENLDRTAREVAVGAIVYTISSNDAVADRRDSFVSYCDDCIVVRLALQSALANGGVETESIRSRFPEFFADLSANLDVCKAVLGNNLFGWLGSKVEGLAKLEYKGKRVAEYIDDTEAAALLYEDGLGFTTEYPVEEETLADKLKRAATLVEAMERRRADELRSRR